MILGKIAFGLVGSVALVGTYVVHEGVVRVAVDGLEPKGHHVHLIVPAALVPVGMRFVPEERLREMTMNARPWLPAARIASAELARLPDSKLLEVRGAREHVRITKKGDLLVVDVESPRETVHISVPLKMVDRVGARLQELAEPEI